MEVEQKLSVIAPRLSRSFFSTGFCKQKGWQLLFLSLLVQAAPWSLPRFIVQPPFCPPGEPSFTPTWRCEGRKAALADPFSLALKGADCPAHIQQCVLQRPMLHSRGEPGPGKAPTVPVAAFLCCYLHGEFSEGILRMWGTQRMFQSGCFTFSDRKLCNP